MKEKKSYSLFLKLAFVQFAECSLATRVEKTTLNCLKQQVAGAVLHSHQLIIK